MNKERMQDPQTLKEFKSIVLWVLPGSKPEGFRETNNKFIYSENKRFVITYCKKTKTWSRNTRCSGNGLYEILFK